MSSNLYQARPLFVQAVQLLQPVVDRNQVIDAGSWLVLDDELTWMSDADFQAAYEPVDEPAPKIDIAKATSAHTAAKDPVSPYEASQQAVKAVWSNSQKSHDASPKTGPDARHPGGV